MSFFYYYGINSGGGIPFDPLSDPSIIMWLSGDNPANTTTTLDISFNPSDVNTTTSVITVALPATQFVRGSNYNSTRVKFTTTGTLPAPLDANKEYLIEDLNNGTAVLYPVLSDADFAMLPSYVSGEVIPPHQAYAFKKNKIIFTTQGTGVHKIVSEPIITKIADKTANAIDFGVGSKLNETFRLLTDGSGRKYIEKPGALGKPQANYDFYGKVIYDNVSGATLGSLWSGKRFMYSVIVANMKFNNSVSLRRQFFLPSAVNTGTGVITAINHSVPTGTKVAYGVIGDTGTFPTPTVSFASNIYLRSVSADTFTLHPTATDATNNTNKYVYSSAGSGEFYVVDNAGAQTESCTRQIIYDVCSLDTNGHDFSPSNYVYHQIIDCAGSIFFGDGSSGLLFETAQQSKIGRNFTSMPIKIFVPPESVPPTCNDTGLRLTSGTYWISNESTNNVYLYRTQAHAIARTPKITYNKTGASGNILFYIEKAFFRGFDDGTVLTTSDTLNDNNKFGIFVLIRDYAKTAGTILETIGFNAVNNVYNNRAIANTNYSLITNAANNIKSGNAAETHVSSFLDEYETFLGVSNTDPTTSITNLINYTKEKYFISVTLSLSISATTETSLALTWTISGTSYNVRVKAVNASNISSDYSNTVTQRTTLTAADTFYSTANSVYSLRKLNPYYTGNCIRIRRSNDNAETNIGFVGKDLDTATITSFVGANSAFVTTMYNQSGNGLNLTQTTALNQPRIVNAGVIDTLPMTYNTSNIKCSQCLCK